MCYPLPGPRCASHLKTDIVATRNTLRELDAALTTDGDNKNLQQQWTTAHNKLTDLGIQYDGTKTGQTKLDELITHAPNRTTQNHLIGRKAVAKELYDSKKQALAVTQATATNLDEQNKILYLQGRDDELVQNLLKNAPLDPKETLASRRQAEHNALINFKARMEPYTTVTSMLASAPTVRNYVVPKGYSVVSGKSKLGFGQEHFVFKGDNPTTGTLIGHVHVTLQNNFSVRANAYRGDGVIGGEKIAAQTSHLDYFKAIIDKTHISPEREKFDYDDIRRLDWAAADKPKKSAHAARNAA